MVMVTHCFIRANAGYSGAKGGGYNAGSPISSAGGGSGSYGGYSGNDAAEQLQRSMSLGSNAEASYEYRPPPLLSNRGLRCGSESCFVGASQFLSGLNPVLLLRTCYVSSCLCLMVAFEHRHADVSASGPAHMRATATVAVATPAQTAGGGGRTIGSLGEKRLDLQLDAGTMQYVCKSL